MRKIIFTWLWWGATLAWAGVIFYLSNQPGYGYIPEGTSIDPWVFAIRKAGHVSEYALLTLLLLRSLSFSFSIATTLRAVVVLALLYAVSDELHQTFVYARDGRVMDVVIDLLGVLSAAILWSNWKSLEVKTDRNFTKRDL